MMRTSIAILLALLAGLPAAAAGIPGNAKVACNAAEDKLSVDVKESSFTALMKEIGQKCGLDIKVDPEAEKPVTLKFTGVSLEDGLKVIGEDVAQNYVLMYLEGTDDTGRHIRKIGGMRVLWSGKGGPTTSDTSASTPAAYRAPQVPTPSPEPQVSTPAPAPTPEERREMRANAAEVAKQRRERYLQSLPPEQRERVLKLEEERARRREEREIQRQKDREMRMRLRENQ